MKPYSVATLANRWGCHASVIRRMIRAGKIAVFRVGDLIRIAHSEVESWEKSAKITVSEDTEESTRLSTSKETFDAAARSARLTARQPRQLLSSSNVTPLRPLGD